MGVADALEKELPFLRRYARAITGSTEQGDLLVEDMLVGLLDADEYPQDRPDLFSGLDRIVASFHPSTGADEIAALSTDARRAFLLTAMEGFTLSETARIMGLEASAVTQLIVKAEEGLTATLATKVFIIEDEPLVAAHIAQVAREMGHAVNGQAVTRKSAVEACLGDPPGLLLVDVQLADGSSGIDAVQEINERFDIPAIFITAYPQRLLTGEKGEPAYLISKPFRPDMVKAVMSQALIQRTLRHAE